jgi:ABC-type Zn uptake system ZnuABC Zn-binding protein ZnuA
MNDFVRRHSVDSRRASLARVLLAGMVALALAACGPAASPAAPPAPRPAAEQHADEEHAEALPPLQPADLAPGDKLHVVATTNVIADVVAQVGQNRVELVGLVPAGADPHAFQATPADLRALNAAHVVFVNGLNLEENLLPTLNALDTGVPLVSVNSGVEPLAMAGDESHDHDHGEADPHTWFDVANVVLWTDTIAAALSALDPANAAAYAEAASAYQEELAALDQSIRSELDLIPPAKRKLVTDHDALGYFAHAYGFEVVGAVVPSLSTLAAPSAQDLAALQDQIRAEGVPAVFVDTAVNPNLATRIAADTGMRVVPLYTGSLSAADGPASTYVDMMRYTAQAMVDALR